MDAQEAADRAEAYEALVVILNTPAETLITSQDKPNMASVAPRLRGPLHEMFRQEVEHFLIRARSFVETGRYRDALLLIVGEDPREHDDLAEFHRILPVLRDLNGREQSGGTCLELDSMNQHLSVLLANLTYLVDVGKPPAP